MGRSRYAFLGILLSWLTAVIIKTNPTPEKQADNAKKELLIIETLFIFGIM